MSGQQFWHAATVMLLIAETASAPPIAASARNDCEEVVSAAAAASLAVAGALLMAETTAAPPIAVSVTMINARTRFFIGVGQLPLYSVSTARRCCRQGLADLPIADPLTPLSSAEFMNKLAAQCYMQW
jgi:hypothetical protein